MKKFCSFTLFLLKAVHIYSAAQVGFNKVGYVANLPVNTSLYYSATIDSEGKILLAGATIGSTGLIVKLNYNGSLDTSFNAPDGFINTRIDTNASIYNGVAVDSQGRIVAVGQTQNTEGLIARFNHDGSLDTTFNAPHGCIKEAMGTDSLVFYKAIFDAQNRIIAVGQTDHGQGLIARLNSNGSFDNSFNGTGFIILEQGTNSNLLYDVIIDAEGKIIVVGRTTDFKGFIARIDVNGGLDTTFNAPDGFINQEGETGAYFYHSIAIDDQGRIVVSGSSNPNSPVGVIARFNRQGLLDRTFNGTGYINVADQTNARSYYSVKIDEQGKIFAAGVTNVPTGIIARFNSDGTLDKTFNQTGYINRENGINTGIYLSVMIDSKKKIVSTGHNNGARGVVTRYFENGILDAEYNWNSKIYRESARINNTAIGMLS